MATLDELERALRAADQRAQQGDEEARKDARLLAQQYRARKAARDAGRTGEEPSGASNIMAGVNVGIARGLGEMAAAPLTLAELPGRAAKNVGEMLGFDMPDTLEMAEPVSQAVSETAESGMRALGEAEASLTGRDQVNVADPIPGSMGERIGEEVGMAATMLLPAGGLGRARRFRAGEFAPHSVPVNIPRADFDAGKAIQPALEALRRRPVASALADLGLAIPGGAGAYIGREVGEGLGGEAGGAVGEATGQVAGALAPAAMADMAINFVRGTRRGLGFTDDDLTQAAGDVMRRSMARPVETETALTGGMTDYPKYGRPTTGEYVDDPGLIAAQRSLARRSEQAAGRSQDVVEQQQESLRGGLAELPGARSGKQDVPVRMMEQRVEQIRRNVDARVNRAIRDSRERLAGFETDQTIDRISQVGRESLEGARDFGRQAEKRVWQMASDTDEFDVSPILEGAQRFMARLPRATDPKDVDDAIRGLAEGKIWDEPIQSFEEVQALRSRLLDSAAEARRAGRANKARIASRFAESLTEDIRPLSGSPEMWEVARRFSREFNDRFTRGPIGEVLGVARDRGPLVDPAKTMERLITPGTDGLLGLRAMRRAAEVQAGEEGARAVDDVTRNYMRAKFAAEATDETTGEFNVSKARGFVNRYSQVLDELPDLKQRMVDTNQARMIADRVSDAAKRRLRKVEKQSLAARYTEGEPARQAEAVLNSRRPLRDARQLMNKARQGGDDAVEGVQAAFFDEIVRRVAPDTQQALSRTERTVTQAKKLRELVETHGPVIREVYGKQGVDLVREIARGATMAARITRGMAAGGGPDTAQNVQSMRNMAGAIGMTLGSKAGALVGAHQLAAAGRGTQAATGLVDRLQNTATERIMAIVENALLDPDAGRTLLKNTRGLTRPEEEQIMRYVTGSVAGRAAVGSDEGED